ncbi:tRNA (mnm(5)s(2)U34)-methyltransferase [Ammoniphilus resinae]|uniref:16S rRNA C1402 N4-methylase RsmH n=1 Tax=Ammoniphilus resinae TaxID=861532 RepID=A0ABS4GMU0_9BACL|nr:class I SAM-dependent methyltransferase [Ammoniphilus resinae]MBP1931574.1 16S rRNA C1402 N4-methylase RsmH [Ammoniphilus resinae]
MFPRITEYVHQLMKERVKEGDTCIDATMGNGHDTLFLAHLVGEKGKVIAYDIQEQALEKTRELLIQKKLHHCVELKLCSHDKLEQSIKAPSLIIFNLGYLPGSDKKVTTIAKTTIPAIKRALELISEEGIIIVVVYPGHDSGRIEKEELEKFTTTIPYPQYIVLKYEYVNIGNNPPFIFAIEKRKGR